jgi:hypothetical protein
LIKNGVGRRNSGAFSVFVCMARRDIVYVPILKSKAGERWALSQLDAKTIARIRPLLEFHPHKSKLVGDHIEGVCEALQAAWGVNLPFYVDTIWLHGDSGSPAIIAEVFESTEEADLQAIPVVRPTYDDASLEQLQDIITGYDRGYLLRITPQTLNTPELIESIVEMLEVAKNKIDLLLDYRNHPMTLGDDIPKVPDLPKWQSLIASSGVFPKSLLSFPLHKWHSLPRHDWLSWQQGIGSGIKRKPIYSDYTMRPPGAPAEFGDPSVNLRYALDDHWLVQMGGKHKEGAAVQIHAMASELVARDEFLGADFSKGDEEIDRVTDEDEGPGGPTQWLQWCANHHIEFVIQQLSPDVA